MPPPSPWPKILQAQTTSQAINLASQHPLPLLSETPLPAHFENLSAHARKNAKAVRRALGVSIPGLPQNGWEHWQETSLDKLFFKQNSHGQQNGHSAQQCHASFTDGNDSGEGSPSPKKRRVAVSASKVAEKHVARTDAFDRPHLAKPIEKTNQASTGEPAHVISDQPSAAEFKHAEALKQWASISPHTAPPSQAVQVVSRCTAVETILQQIVPNDTMPQLLGPIVRVLTESIGTSFANHVIIVLVKPYMKSLSAPASRDVMDALVAFSRRHWRASLVLYEVFMGRDCSVNGAVAEILVRISAVLNAEGSLQALQACCRGTWGEDGVRVVEALLGRCKNNEGVATLLVAALQRNVIGSEKSVRFGKLLFTVVKDLPGTAKHAEAIEAVCSRCKVFLAKRALSLVQSKQRNA